MLSRPFASIGVSLCTLAFFAGCSASSADLSAPAAPPPTVVRAFVPDASDAGTADEVAKPSAMAPTFKGNQLCHALYTQGCFPDDDLTACSLALDDGGQDDGGPNAAQDAAIATACHVVSSGATPTACLPAGLGLTNATCSQSTDCAAGHECVGTGLCRHYCCGGNASCQVNEFCDVQPTAEEPAMLVPVCMPEVPCALLDDGGCPSTQQCSVVREDGSTSCVNVGTARDGDLCDVEHCARGLVCIGAQNGPRCAPLCRTANALECQTTGRMCVGTLPLFQNATIGACQ